MHRFAEECIYCTLWGLKYRNNSTYDIYTYGIGHLCIVGHVLWNMGFWQCRIYLYAWRAEAWGPKI